MHCHKALIEFFCKRYLSRWQINWFQKTLAKKNVHLLLYYFQLSREENLWQNELKDLIWLELQAWHADRSPTEQDSYLCFARESVDALLDDIMSYRFTRDCHQLSTRNSDSGVEDGCDGCLSMHCHACMEAQNKGLKDVEKLMNRLEAVEALFPSSKAFAEMYPIYNSVEFMGRVKAMCLWYNMTKHQLLKLVILGRLLTLEDR